MKKFFDSKLHLLSLLTSLILATLPWTLNAQQQTFCETEPAPNLEYNTSVDPMQEEGPFYLRIYIHVIQDGDGNGGQTPEQVNEALAYLDEAFNPHNIFFVRNCAINYIKNTNYFNSIFGTSAVFSINNHPDGIDIYLFPDRPFPVNTGMGFANGVLSAEFYVAGNFWRPPYPPIVRSHVISHEMGHCLGLNHPHFQTSPTMGQFVNDPICDTEIFTPNGDKICDTPADPNMEFNVDPNTCLWNDIEYDVNNDLFNPDEKNIMGYSHVDCQEYFSDGQGKWMRNKIASEQLLQDCLIPFTFTDHQIITTTTWAASEYLISGTLTVESGATFTVSAGTTIRFAEGSKLILKPNAILNLDGILTSFCGRTWKGVEVWGNTAASQFPIGGVLAQGKFVGRPGSIVENAEIGVQLWGPDLTGSGGQISCIGTTFKNNIISVTTAKYENTWPFPFPPG